MPDGVEGREKRGGDTSSGCDEIDSRAEK